MAHCWSDRGKQTKVHSVIFVRTLFIVYVKLSQEDTFQFLSHFWCPKKGADHQNRISLGKMAFYLLVNHAACQLKKLSVEFYSDDLGVWLSENFWI